LVWADDAVDCGIHRFLAGDRVPVMEWDDNLVLDRGVMDDTHREFIGLLNRLADAPDDETLAVLDEFIAHTEAHFAHEQRWMEQMSFPPIECHVREHDGVLEIAREVRSRAAAGETGFGRVLAQAVAQWFANHAASMDNVLALYMKEVGYKPDTHFSPALSPKGRRGWDKCKRATNWSPVQFCSIPASHQGVGEWRGAVVESLTLLQPVPRSPPLPLPA
jgi:hemerythrin-like metal-binding protein